MLVTLTVAVLLRALTATIVNIGHLLLIQVQRLTTGGTTTLITIIT